MKKESILIVFNDMSLGGIQRKIIDIINHIKKEKPNTRINICLQRKEGIFLSKIPPEIKIYHQKINTKKLNMIWYVLCLIKTIIKTSPTHILTFIDSSSIPSIIASRIVFWKKIKIIIGEDILTSKHIFTETRPLLRKFLIEKLYPYASKILVQTNIQKKDLELIIKHPHSKLINVSPNWLSPEFNKKNTNIKKTIDILYLGRIDSQKNIKRFIDIIDLVKNNKKDIKATIVGSGEEFNLIKKTIKNRNLDKNISITTATKYPQNYYKKSKIFLITSNYEGFPLTLLESISFDCFPICSNIPEISTYFNDNDKIIYNNNDQAVKNILKELKKTDTNTKKQLKENIIKNQQINITKYVNYIFK